MLMAQELSSRGSGNSEGLPSGGQAAPADPSSILPFLGERLAQAPLTSAEAQDPQSAASPASALDKKSILPSAPVLKKPEPTPIAQVPAKQASPEKAQSGQTMAEAPSPEPKVLEANRAQTASTAPTDRTKDPAQDSLDSGNGLSPTAKLQAAVEGHPQGAGRRSGAPGNGAPGTGQDIGAKGSGSPDAAGSLIRFGAPGGPGIVRMVQPRYPSEARRLGKEGVVILKLSLDEAGTVYEVEVLQGGGFGMEEASREAIMLSRFRPATSKGRPVASQAILPIRFKLR